MEVTELSLVLVVSSVWKDKMILALLLQNILVRLNPMICLFFHSTEILWNISCTLLV